jgi:hypothetical protein
VKDTKDEGWGCTEQILTGGAFVVASGLVLFFVYGFASMAAAYLADDDPRYWPKVVGEMFDDFALGTVPAMVGMLLGVVFLATGICKGRSSNPGASGEP